MDKKSFKLGFITGMLLVVVFGIYAYLNAESLLNDITTKPIELAQLEIENLNSESIQLTKGKPKVINFWATWCAPCVQEFPEFEEMNTKYGDQIEFVMISDEDVAKIKKFKDKKGFHLELYRSLKKLESYEILVRPATFFYNSEGKLINKISGGLTKADLEREIQVLLKK